MLRQLHKTGLADAKLITPSMLYNVKNHLASQDNLEREITRVGKGEKKYNCS